MAKQGTKAVKAKKETVKPVEKEVTVNEFVQEEVETTVEAKPEVVEEKKEDTIKKVWVKDWRELVSVEGVNQTQRGKEYYGVKRKS